MSNDDHLRLLFSELGFITSGCSMLPTLRLAEKASCISDITILVEGETGTGKQVLASAIHKLDPKRSSHPFITVHCGTITETLAESELFGHHKGAFSGAVQNRKGLFQAANNGTLFLDDINDLPLPLQAKLLDVLQRRVIRAVGSDQESPINARIVAASNQPLLPLVAENRFRSDLYHRLNVVKISLPPLRKRPDDIEGLLIAFAARHIDLYLEIKSVESDLVRFLRTQAFPGNVRELEHAVERMLFHKTAGTSLTLADWTAQSEGGEEATHHPDVFCEAGMNLWKAIIRDGLTYSDAMNRLDAKLLEAAFEGGTCTRREIASRLQTSERSLYYRLRSHRTG